MSVPWPPLKGVWMGDAVPSSQVKTGFMPSFESISPPASCLSLLLLMHPAGIDNKLMGCMPQCLQLISPPRA